jgi:flagellar basal-body rod modification protein FlgD
MTTSPISPNDPAAGLGTGASTQTKPGGDMASALGKQDFLNLLMAQMQHQDPMEPLKDHEFVAQLATFSGLEQQMLSNDRLLELQLAQVSSGNAQLAGFIGQSVVAKGDSLTIGSGKTPPIGIQLDGAADKVTVTVRTADGTVVNTFEQGPLSAGNHDLSWSGKDQSGQPLPPGEYTVQVEATDATGQAVGASALLSGIVDGVSFASGYAELIVGDHKIKPADIISVGAVPNASSSGTEPDTTSSSGG